MGPAHSRARHAAIAQDRDLGALASQAQLQGKAREAEERRQAVFEEGRRKLDAKATKWQEAVQRGQEAAAEATRRRAEACARKDERAQAHRTAVEEERERRASVLRQASQSRQQSASRAQARRSQERARASVEAEVGLTRFLDVRKAERDLHRQLTALVNLPDRHPDALALQWGSDDPSTLNRAPGAR